MDAEDQNSAEAGPSEIETQQNEATEDIGNHSIKKKHYVSKRRNKAGKEYTTRLGKNLSEAR